MKTFLSKNLLLNTILKRKITTTETVIKSEEIIHNTPTKSIPPAASVETQAPIIGSVTNQTSSMDDLSKMIDQNANDLDKLADKLNKYKEKTITQKEEKEEALQSSSSSNQKIYQETVNETSNNVELDDLANRLKTPNIINLEDNVELVGKDGVNQVMDEIKLAAAVTTEVLTNQLKKHAIDLEKTEEANKRTATLYKRAEELLRSIENPGRIAKYTVFGLTIGYTIYNIVRYGQIPFSGLLGGVGSAAAANAVNHSVSPSISPNIAPTINVNFPAQVNPSVPIATPPMGDFMQGFINSPWLGATLFGMGYLLKYLRR